jgi:anti-anti-sigma factor
MGDDPEQPEAAGPIPRPFTVEVGEAPDGAAMIILQGEMDMAAIRSFRAGVDAAIDDRQIRTLILDMAEVSFMDSSMLRELLRLNQELRQQGAWPVLAGLQGPVRRLLDLTRTAELFRLADSREAALARSAGA